MGRVTFVIVVTIPIPMPTITILIITTIIILKWESEWEIGSIIIVLDVIITLTHTQWPRVIRLMIGARHWWAR